MFSPVGLIQKKRDGGELTQDEIRQFIEGVTRGEIPDYQATAFLMTVYFRGMTLDETVGLTRAMLLSGERYDLAAIPGKKADKHSTGGVGDKVSLILAPLAAACGLKVPMMSGRGLGHSGGTLDKLESIRGLDVRLPRERFEEVLRKVGCAMIGQTDSVAPADRKLYSLRDVTGTVECIPLIVASILSKKLAEGSESLVLDVKVGSGAFMKTRAQGRELAQALTKVSRKLGLPCRALLTDMNQPLGYAVGNALEVRECIEVLRNQSSPDRSSADLKELTIQLTAAMLQLSGESKNRVEGRKLAHARLADGSAWNVFLDLVRAQNGDIRQILDPGLLPKAPRIVSWKARKRGYISRMDTETLGRLLVELGGGRKKITDQVDPSVGFIFHRKLGAPVKAGEPIVTVHASEQADLAELERLFHGAVEITRARKPVPRLIMEEI